MLAQLGLRFEVEPAHIDESLADLETRPAHGERVETLAWRKARVVAERRESGLIIGSDTIVCLDDLIFEKPVDATGARRTLQVLRGKTHTVYTGLCLLDAASDNKRLGHSKTSVTMANYSDTEITAYINSGEPMDKAGAYGIQGLGATLVEKIEGEYTGVVGLPLFLFSQFLKEISEL